MKYSKRYFLSEKPLYTVFPDFDASHFGDGEAHGAREAAMRGRFVVYYRVSTENRTCAAA
jgi:hypothetical protein